MMSSPERTLVLVGPMAAGKTSVGRRVAKRLGVPFRDSDRMIAATHGPIPEIFAQHGEAHFRTLEREEIAGLVTVPGVLALGGGAVMDAETRARLRAVPVVLLTVTAEAVAARLAASGRPLLDGADDRLAQWTKISQEREEWYREVADVTFDTSHAPLTQIAEKIAEWAQHPPQKGANDEP